MFPFGENLSQVPPVPKDHGVTPPPPRNAALPHVATVYNKCTGGGECWCVSIWSHKPTWPSFMHVCSFVCLFGHLLSPPPPPPPVKVSRTSSCETQQKYKEIWYCNEATGIRIFIFCAYTLILEKNKKIYKNSNTKAASCLPSLFRC
jgi:hypothetical protein